MRVLSSLCLSSCLCDVYSYGSLFALFALYRAGKWAMNKSFASRCKKKSANITNQLDNAKKHSTTRR